MKLNAAIPHERGEKLSDSESSLIAIIIPKYHVIPR